MDQDEREFLEAALVGGRGLANRHQQKVTVVQNNFKNRLQHYFITSQPSKKIRETSHLRPYLYILPDRCPVIKKARNERERYAIQYRKQPGGNK